MWLLVAITCQWMSSHLIVLQNLLHSKNFSWLTEYKTQLPVPTVGSEISVLPGLDWWPVQHQAVSQHILLQPWFTTARGSGTIQLTRSGKKNHVNNKFCLQVPFLTITFFFCSFMHSHSYIYITGAKVLLDAIHLLMHVIGREPEQKLFLKTPIFGQQTTKMETYFNLTWTEKLLTSLLD